MLLRPDELTFELADCLDLVANERVEELLRELREAHSGVQMAASPGRVCRIDIEGKDSSLLVVRSEAHVQFFAVAIGAVTRDQVETWSVAVRSASESLPDGYESVRWEALLGPRRQRGPYGRAIGQTPTGAFSFGRKRQLAVEPTDHWVAQSYPRSQEWLSPHYHTNYEQFRPVRVSEVCEGRLWALMGDAAAASTLNLVCAALSIAWDEPWTVRLGPVATETPLEVPSADETKLHDPDWQGNAMAIPPWLTDHWQKLEAGGPLRRAAEMFYEALCAQDEHPALSVLAYTATIESLAQIRDEAQRCGECGSVTQIAQRFEEALSSVDAARGARGRYLYDRGSLIRHRADMLGTKSIGLVPSAYHSPLWGPSDEREMLKTIQSLRPSARALLLRELESEDNPPP